MSNKKEQYAVFERVWHMSCSKGVEVRMQRIRFTYKSSEVCPSVFLLLYFRMTGIYVYERFFDSGREKADRLLNRLPEVEGINRIKPYENFDLELFCVSDKEDYQLYQEQYGNNVLLPTLIITFGKVGDGLTEGNMLRIVKYSKNQDEQLLNDIISAMEDMGIIPAYTKEELLLCAGIYFRNKVWNISLLGKYFYIAEAEKSYKQIVNQYRETINEIFAVLQNKECNWGDKEYIHLQYAALNISYEGNQYCIRNNRSLIYKPQGMARICRELLKGRIDREELGDSFYLLLAQIYDDLLHDPNQAYEYYLFACQDYNAYAYYRKGVYWQEYVKDYKNAIRYYTKSVYIYPEYYRVWYRLGRCYMLISECSEALDMFRNVGRILKPRLQAQNVRPMEIEYLFKAQNQCGYICNKVLNNPQQAILENIGAVEAWDAIEQSKFFEIFNEEEDTVRKRVKKELNVSKIYTEIYKLADKIGDVQLKANYLDKLLSV